MNGYTPEFAEYLRRNAGGTVQLRIAAGPVMDEHGNPIGVAPDEYVEFAVTADGQLAPTWKGNDQ